MEKKFFGKRFSQISNLLRYKEKVREHSAFVEYAAYAFTLLVVIFIYGSYLKVRLIEKAM